MEKDYHLIIFDADGTLRRCTVPGQPCPNQPGEWELLPYVADDVRARIRENVHIGIASNQAGVGLGYMTEETARQLLIDMVVQMTGDEHPSVAIAMCTHTPRAGCACRKPAPGMLLELMKFFDVFPDDTLYVGDMESDEQAAKAAGCDFVYANDYFGWDVD